MAMLRHRPSGDLYIYTTILAARTDMEVIEDAVEATVVKAPATPTPKKAVRARKAKVVEPVSPTVEEVVVTDSMEAEIAGLLAGDEE